MTRMITVATLLIAVTAATSAIAPDQPALLPRLSGYHIYAGDPATLTPDNGFQPYELATGLFTDYAEKQRLIKVPTGTTITVLNDGLPQFPEGTLLVKTFYYFHDKSNPAAGKRLIETRLLIKNNGRWLAGTYVWNAAQTDAILATSGSTTPVNWIDEQGHQQKITYRIPGTRDCAACHNANNVLQPVGIQVRNLNRTVLRNKEAINQLTYLHQAGVMEKVNPQSFAALPNWQKEQYSVQDRVRAYLEVNCAHCHREVGSCARSAVRFSWELPMAATGITAKRTRILRLMANGRMPRLGTTVIDTAALALLKQYFQLP